MITIRVNGRPRQLESPTPLPRFLEQLGVTSQRIAVAYNGEVLRKSEYEKVTLQADDVLEIVRPIGGGSHL